MDFGLHLGTRGAAAHPDNLVALAQHADALGFGHLGFSDHVVIARKIDSRYPYSESGDWPGVATGYCLEQLSCLAYAAAVTKRIRLLTSVMVIPHRPAVLTAKTLATIDVLSKGRVTVGVGVGWMAEEMALLGAPPFADRAKASDEYMQAFRELWTAASPQMQGQFAHFGKLKFEPKPVQKPHPPLWVGGEIGAARRRAGRLGDGWYPVAANPNAPLDTADLYAAGLAEVRGEAVKAGRKDGDIAAAILAIYCKVGSEQKGRTGGRQAFTGSAQAIIDDIAAYRARGLEHFLIGGDGYDLNGTLDHLERFASEVMAKVKP